MCIRDRVRSFLVGGETYPDVWVSPLGGGPFTRLDCPQMASRRSSDSVQLARRLYAVTSSGDFAQLDGVLTPDVLDHGVDGAGGPSEDDLRGVEAVRQSLIAFRAAFPDAKLEVQDAFASDDGERVAMRWTVTGTHRATFHGVPATGRVVRMSCLLYTSPSPRDRQKSRMPSSA